MNPYVVNMQIAFLEAVGLMKWPEARNLLPRPERSIHTTLHLLRERSIS